MVRYLVIVARDRPGLLARLTYFYGDEEWFEVLPDRRRRERRAAMRSGPDRRSPPSSETDVVTHGHIVVRASSHHEPVPEDSPG